MTKPATHWRRVGVAFAALIVAYPALAQFGNANPQNDPYDSAMPTYAQINWKDPLNLSYVNLGNDQLLVDTTNGVQLWDIPTNRLSAPKFSPSLSSFNLKALDYGTFQNWARLGGVPVGTALVSFGAGNDRAGYTILWWDGASRQFSASLPVDWGRGSPRVLALGPRLLLVCGYSVGSKVARLHQSGGESRLEWEHAGNPEARDALRRKGVVGTVIGFGPLSETGSDRPVLYDATRCGWEFRDPPKELAAYLDRKTRRHDPSIKPYFLADGRILVSEVSYFNHDKKHWQDMNPPLLWEPATRRWRAIEPTSGRGGQHHRVGSEAPVMSHAFASKIIEFLDVRTMKWTRSRQRLPDVQVTRAHLEPLSNGSVLVLTVTPFTPGGTTGLVVPMRTSTPPGQLAFKRYRYDGEITLRNGGLMLVGDGSVWDPSVRSEIIDVARNQARSIASLTEPQVSPAGLELKDGSILVFGGLPPRCGPRFYFMTVEPCSRLPARPSYRYIPDKNRWQALPNLKIPFTRGYWWETGNSDLASQWPRNDARVRRNGEFVWIEGGEFFGDRAEELSPKTTLIKRWRPYSSGSAAVKTLARLLKARQQSTLIELADGRLAVMGGSAQLELVALEKECFDCPDKLVSIGPFRAAHTTELLDESRTGQPRWRFGPASHFGGGRALKLANGRIFKLSLTDNYDSGGYRAEVADAAFTRWEKLPPFPVKSAIVRNASVAGNRILILTSTAQTAVWDDEAGRWNVLEAWPRNAGSKSDPPISISSLDDGERVLVRYSSTFEIVSLPK